MMIWLLVLTIVAAALVCFVGFVARARLGSEPVWADLGALPPMRRAQHGQGRQVRLESVSGEPENVRACVPGLDQAKNVVFSSENADEFDKEPWADRGYCWVVVCKNHWFHRHPNTFNVHRIPLGVTDAYAARPAIRKPFRAHCDECGKEYFYKPPEVLRYEMDVPSSFVPHELFRD